jgi:hypothetical protein
MTKLLKLYNWLHKNNFKKLAQEIKDLDTDTEEYAEPWHQEAVEEFGDEIIPELDEDPLDKQTLQIKNQFIPISGKTEREAFQEIAAKEDFKIIETGSKPTIAGRGGYGIVFRGVYQGKPAVAKIILGDLGAQEIDNWDTIQRASKSAVPELKPYLPIIYKINTESEEEDSNSNPYINNYSIVIMEELLPISDHITEQIYSERPFGVFDLAKDEELLWSLANVYFKYLVQTFDDLKRTEVFNWLLSVDFKLIKDRHLVVGNLPSFFNLKIFEKIQEKYPFKEQIRKVRSHPIYNGFDSVLSDEILKFFRQRLPPDFTNVDEGKHLEYLPETKGLIKALKKLTEMTGLGWADLYMPKNLMMGADGNLKIIDVGIYEQLDDSQYEEFIGNL